MYEHVCVSSVDPDGGCLQTISEHEHICFVEEDGTRVYDNHCCPECGCRQYEGAVVYPCEAQAEYEGNVQAEREWSYL